MDAFFFSNASQCIRPKSLFSFSQKEMNCLPSPDLDRTGTFCIISKLADQRTQMHTNVLPGGHTYFLVLHFINPMLVAQK
jgi:hypothetical protein